MEEQLVPSVGHQNPIQGRLRIAVSAIAAVILVSGIFTFLYFFRADAPKFGFPHKAYSQVSTLVQDKVSASAAIAISLPIKISVAEAKASISFEPAVQGRWIEGAPPGQLLFQPDSKLETGKYYSVVFDNKELRLAKDFYVVEDPEIVAIFPAAGTEAPENTEITIIFSRPMVPLTTLDVLYEKEVPVELVPATPGRFKWTTTRNLQFLPETRLARSTNYTVRIKPGFVSIENLPIPEITHTFTTRPIRYSHVRTGETLYRQPIRIVFNQPFDLSRTEREITVSKSQGGQNVNFVAMYGTRVVTDRETKERKTITDKSILEIYNAEDRHGRAQLWDFDTQYYFVIKKAYPLEGDINLDESRNGNIYVPEIIRSLSATSPRSRYVKPEFFDPQGILWVSFYEEIDKDRSVISAQSISEIGYDEKCKPKSGGAQVYYRNTEECEKVPNKTKIYLKFNTNAFGTSQAIPIEFRKIVNVEGLQLNAEPIVKTITTYPKLEILKTIPQDGASAGDIEEFILCTSTPLEPADEDTFDERMDIEPPIGLWSWRSPIRITPSNASYHSCAIGQFENTIKYGLRPEIFYRVDLDVIDDFEQIAQKSLTFTSGKLPDLSRKFYQLHKRYNVTSPEKVKLTYAVENLEYVNMHICEVSAPTMLNYLGNRPDSDENPQTYSCLKRVEDRIELPKKYWTKNYFQVDLADYLDDPIGHYVISFSHPEYRRISRQWDSVRRIYIETRQEQIYEHTLLTVTGLAVQEKKLKWEPSTYRPDPHEDVVRDALSDATQNLYWVTAFGTIQGVADAKVDLYQEQGASSRPPYLKAKSTRTDFQGIARAEAVKNLVGAIVSKGDDSTIVSTLTDRLQWASSARSVERTYIYTDRPIYRPGDKVSLKGLYRIGYDADYEIFRDKPAEIEIFNSRGESALKQTVEISEFGTFTTSFVIDSQAPLGTYRISAFGGTGHFDVEEYVPSPFKVEVRSDEEEYGAGDTMKLTIDADYFFGVPLEGGEVEYSIVSQDYFFDRYEGSDFQFGRGWYYSYNRGYGDTFILRGETELNDAGEAYIEQKLDFDELFGEDDREKSKIFLVRVTVKNRNGQAVSTQESFIVHRGEFYLGLDIDKTFFGKGDPFTVKVKSVDTQGKAVSVRNITLEINKITWEYFKRQEVDGGYYYQSEKKVESVETLSISTDGSGNYRRNFTVKGEGQYEIAVRTSDRNGNPIIETRSFYVYGPGVVSVRPTNNESLDLVVDKIDVDVGEEVQFVIKSPYTDAKALVTIERGKIFHYDIIDINQNLVEYKFKVADEYIPNVYVSVLLVSSKPEIKFGQINYKVNTKQREIQIDIKSNKNHYLPGEQVHLDVIATDWQGNPVEAELSLAVADLSVLALKGNPKKNPLIFFYGGMPLTVTTASNIKNILFEIEIPLGTKGGGGAELAEDLARKKRGLFLDTAFWQGVVRTDSAGRASVSFTLPDNLTSWQVESVGITRDTKLGAGYGEFITRKEVMVVPLRPRFIIPGDEFLLGAKVFNQTEGKQTLDVSFASDTLESIDGNTSETVSLKSGETKTIYFSVRAPQNIQTGNHTFVLSAKNTNFEDTVENSISITRNNTYESTATAHFTGDAVSREYVYLPENIVPDRGGVKVTAAATLAVFLSDSLNYLVSYPYGCSEQIASKLSSIAIVKRGLAIENIGDKFTLDKIVFEGQEYSADDVVEIGLARIYENQTSAGGFTYYRGMRPNFYLTLHIVNTLQDLADAGYAVNRQVVDQAGRYLYNNIPSRYYSKDAVILTAYTLSRLEGFSAENKALKRRVENIIRDTKFIREDISNSSLTHLAILVTRGYSSSSKKEVFSVLENRVEIDARGAFLGLHKTNWLPQYYETPIKDTALLLKALVADKRESPVIDKVLRWLLRSRAKDGSWASTNNTVAAVDAFTDFLMWKEETKSEFKLEVKLDDSKIGEFEFNKDTILEMFETFIPTGDFTLGTISTVEFEKTNRNNAVNTLYYDMSLRYFLPIDQVPPRDEGFSIKREFYQRDDENNENPLSSAKVGDVLRGLLTITVPKASNFVAVEDFIPAGVEIVNLRLATEDQSLKNEGPYYYDGGKNKRQQEGGSVLAGVGGLFGELAGNISRAFKNSLASVGVGEFSALDYDEYVNMPRHAKLRPDAEESHDDRLFLFQERVQPGVYEFEYFVRALIPGTYHHLPAVVSEMYFPENFGRTDGRYFTIEP